MPASSADDGSSCPLSPVTARPATSTTDDLVTLLTRKAGDDPAWWLVVRQYALGHATYPQPFRNRRP